MEKLIKIKIGTGYAASGYGRGNRKKTIYLINGKAYARDKERANSSFEPCKGELKFYVRVNWMKGFESTNSFYQVGLESEHKDYNGPRPEEIKIEQPKHEKVYVEHNPKVETIDLTPSWAAALQIYLAAFEDGGYEGRKAAKAGLRDMARVADAYVSDLKNMNVVKIELEDSDIEKLNFLKEFKYDGKKLDTAQLIDYAVNNLYKQMKDLQAQGDEREKQIEELTQKLANAYVTYAGCGGHGKSAANKSLYEKYTKELEDLGAVVPTNRELSRIGKFNGEGTY